MSTVEEDDEQDLTRKQRREQARSERKALEDAAAANQQRRKRLIQLGSVAGVVVVIIVVIVAATSGGGGKSGLEKTPTGSGKTPGVVTKVTNEIGGIPQKGNVLGSAKAPVTLVYFGDLECPICKDFTLGALPTLIQKYVRTGKLRIEYRNLETATREPETFKTQQIAALAAGKQNKGWDYIELFYNQQGEEGSEYVNEQYLRTLAQQTPGLNLTAWTAARNDPEFTNTITSDAQAANNAGFTGTPSFQIGKTGGPVQKLEYSSLTDPSSFESAINKLA
ncbi:MAG TPA: thioredoxin domain-containing protein [Solirubrobacteraceae bacterium]|jgi:protein-disulfide isomerase|nr:thioredoxin domain-containing protein [Solirubrobacteraceae bacterium]